MPLHRFGMRLPASAALLFSQVLCFSESAAVFIKFLCCGKQPLAAAFFCLLAVFAVL